MQVADLTALGGGDRQRRSGALSGRGGGHIDLCECIWLGSVEVLERRALSGRLESTRPREPLLAEGDDTTRSADSFIFSGSERALLRPLRALNAVYALMKF